MKVGELHWPQGMTVYVDMDGVLADFETGYHRLFGRRPGAESRDDPNIAKLVGTDFFGTLPKYDSADALIQLVLDHAGSYSICTAPLRNDHKNSGHWKREWLAQHISPAPRQIKVNGQKEVYAVGADGVPNVLIDDKPKNIQRWRAAGGIAIEYYAPRDGLDVVARGLRQAAQWRPDAVKESATGDLEQDLRDPLGYDAIDHMMQTISRRHGITADRLHDLFVAKHGCTPDHWIRQGVTEGRSSGYKEIEFICANPKFPNATDPKLQKQMYAGLKQIPGVIPLFQDQSDYSEGQYSLTAIYKDRDVRGQILKLAKQLGVKVDLEQPVTDDYVNRAIRGEHEGQQGVAEGKSNDTAISLSRLGKFHPGADTLAEFVPERATAQYALHPDKWESTFYSLTNKDSDKLKYYGPKKISIPPGTLVGDMAIANKFYRAKTPEEKQQYAEAYKASLQPYPVDVSEYRMPELLIPRQGVAEGLEVDVPNERWLQKKIDYAKRKGRTSYGVPYMGTTNGVPYMGTTTAYTSQNTRVPVDILRQLSGMRGEQQNVRQDNLKALVKIMKDTGRLPMRQGQEYAPFINVAWNGEAWVNEGNHRIMAAAALGWKDLPVQIRYFDGGERVKSGVMYPGRIGLGDIKENFADGRGPGRPGDSKRHGIKKGVTLAQLDRIVHSKTASPRKKQLAHWAANMRRGKAKKK